MSTICIFEYAVKIITIITIFKQYWLLTTYTCYKGMNQIKFTNNGTYKKL